MKDILITLIALGALLLFVALILFELAWPFLKTAAVLKWIFG